MGLDNFNDALKKLKDHLGDKTPLNDVDGKKRGLGKGDPSNSEDDSENETPKTDQKISQKRQKGPTEEELKILAKNAELKERIRAGEKPEKPSYVPSEDRQFRLRSEAEVYNAPFYNRPGQHNSSYTDEDKKFIRDINNNKNRITKDTIERLEKEKMDKTEKVFYTLVAHTEKFTDKEQKKFKDQENRVYIGPEAYEQITSSFRKRVEKARDDNPLPPQKKQQIGTKDNSRIEPKQEIEDLFKNVQHLLDQSQLDIDKQKKLLSDYTQDRHKDSAGYLANIRSSKFAAEKKYLQKLFHRKSDNQLELLLRRENLKNFAKKQSDVVRQEIDDMVTLLSELGKEKKSKELDETIARYQTILADKKKTFAELVKKEQVGFNGSLDRLKKLDLFIEEEFAKNKGKVSLLIKDLLAKRHKATKGISPDLVPLLSSNVLNTMYDFMGTEEFTQAKAAMPIEEIREKITQEQKNNYRKQWEIIEQFFVSANPKDRDSAVLESCSLVLTILNSTGIKRPTIRETILAAQEQGFPMTDKMAILNKFRNRVAHPENNKPITEKNIADAHDICKSLLQIYGIIESPAPDVIKKDPSVKTEKGNKAELAEAQKIINEINAEADAKESAINASYDEIAYPVNAANESKVAFILEHTSMELDTFSDDEDPEGALVAAYEHNREKIATMIAEGKTISEILKAEHYTNPNDPVSMVNNMTELATTYALKLPDGFISDDLRAQAEKLRAERKQKELERKELNTLSPEDVQNIFALLKESGIDLSDIDPDELPKTLQEYKQFKEALKKVEEDIVAKSNASEEKNNLLEQAKKKEALEDKLKKWIEKTLVDFYKDNPKFDTEEFKIVRVRVNGIPLEKTVVDGAEQKIDFNIWAKDGGLHIVSMRRYHSDMPGVPFTWEGSVKLVDVADDFVEYFADKFSADFNKAIEVTEDSHGAAVFDPDKFLEAK